MIDPAAGCITPDCGGAVNGARPCAGELAGRAPLAYPRPMKGRNEREEAQRAALERLDRLQHEGDGLLTSSLAQAGERAAERGADANDPIELWGRRIGRALSIAAFGALLAYLWATYLR
jgi:hypothetical protein